MQEPCHEAGLLGCRGAGSGWESPSRLARQLRRCDGVTKRRCWLKPLRLPKRLLRRTPCSPLSPAAVLQVGTSDGGDSRQEPRCTVLAIGEGLRGELGTAGVAARQNLSTSAAGRMIVACTCPVASHIATQGHIMPRQGMEPNPMAGSIMASRSACRVLDARRRPCGRAAPAPARSRCGWLLVSAESAC
jgi:hypothetical protein